MKRFYVPNIPGSGEMAPEDDLKHRVNDVLRFSEGEELELIDGKGTIAKAIVKGKNKNLRFLIEAVESVPVPKNSVTALVSLIRRERFDVMVEKAVELGASKIVPFVCERSRPYSGDSYEKLRERWQRIADQALSQCKRYFRCEVEDVIELSELKTNDKSKTQFLSFHPGLKPLLPSNIQNNVDIVFAIGPEGGFTDDENKSLEDKGFELYSLTDNILRTETAVMYVLSVLDLAKKI